MIDLDPRESWQEADSDRQINIDELIRDHIVLLLEVAHEILRVFVVVRVIIILKLLCVFEECLQFRQVSDSHESDTAGDA